MGIEQKVAVITGASQQRIAGADRVLLNEVNYENRRKGDH
jgi:hypothetical protein